MSTIIATTLSNGSVSVPTATVVNGSAKAWVNFNGTGTIAARDSFNVASLTDTGTGAYTVNFTASMNNADYAPVYYMEGGFDVQRYQSNGTQLVGSCALRTGLPNRHYFSASRHWLHWSGSAGDLA
jgi:hypothetical protein